MFPLKKIKKEFNLNGFVILRQVFSKKEIGKILNEIEKIILKSIRIKNTHLHYTDDKKVNTIHNINRYIKKDSIINFSKKKEIIDILNCILNERAKVRNIEFFLKPKKTGMRTPFHQDNYYWNFSDKKALNLWIACSESNYKNGGVCYFKQSHKLGLLKHEISYEPGSSQKIPNKYLKKIKLKKIIPHLKIGDCIIHHSEIIHGSNPNKSKKDRIGLVIGYKGINAKVDAKKLKKYNNLVKKNIIYIKENRHSKLHNLN